MKPHSVLFVIVLAVSSAVHAETNPACEMEKGPIAGCTRVSQMSNTLGCSTIVQKRSIVSAWRVLDLETESVLQNQTKGVALFTLPADRWVIVENEITCETGVYLSRYLGSFDGSGRLHLFVYSLTALEKAGKLTQGTGTNFAVFRSNQIERMPR